MIINLNQFGGGGGGGSYVLPVATSEVLGGVMIGDGINVDSAGTISVSGSDVSNYAMALKSLQEGDENNYKVANYGGFLYYVEDNKNTEKNIFVKAMYGSNYVNIDMDIDGQTDTDIVEFNGVTITIDKEGNLFYVNENDEKVYYDSEVSEYQYGDFTFYWDTDGTHIGFSQQANYIEAIPSTDNFENWFCIAQNVNIANQDALGLVKIGEGIDLAEDGTISVEGGGAATIVKSLSEAPTGLTDGDTIILQEANELKMCKVIDDSGNTLNIGRYVWMEMGEPAYLIVNSNAVEDTLAIQFNYYAYKTYVYTGEDGFRYEVTENDEFVSSGAISSSVNVTMGDYTLYFSLLQTNALNIGLPSNVEMCVWQRVDNDRTETSYRTYVYCENETPSVDIDLGGCVQLGDGYFYSEVEFYFDEIPSFEGSAFTICQIGQAGSPESRYIKYTSAGTYVWVGFEQTITLNADGNMHFAYDGRVDKYLISDGYIKIIGVLGDSVPFITIDGDNISGYDKLWNGEINKTGLVEFGRRGIQHKGQHNYSDFIFLCNGQQRRYTENGINITEAPYPVGGNKVLFSPSLENMEWRDLPVAVEIVNALPTFADDGAFVVVNTGVTPSASTAFCAKNTTSSDGKNNFSDYDEFPSYEYLYFDKGDLTAQTKTLIGRIAMRTDENGDWNTSNIAYINVYREYDGLSFYYTWNMPAFTYKNSEGGDATYFTNGVVTNNTSGNTSYLPLWRWWDGGYGYKFKFENNDGNLYIWLRYSSSDADDPDSGWVSGENYGDVLHRFTNHTKEFYNGMSTEGNTITLYTFKGGAWYKLGDLA